MGIKKNTPLETKSQFTEAENKSRFHSSSLIHNCILGSESQTHTHTQSFRTADSVLEDTLLKMDHRLKKPQKKHYTV